MNALWFVIREEMELLLRMHRNRCLSDVGGIHLPAYHGGQYQSTLGRSCTISQNRTLSMLRKSSALHFT